jgi:hypothetical protein
MADSPITQRESKCSRKCQISKDSWLAFLDPERLLNNKAGHSLIEKKIAGAIECSAHKNFPLLFCNSTCLRHWPLVWREESGKADQASVVSLRRAKEKGFSGRQDLKKWKGDRFLENRKSLRGWRRHPAKNDESPRRYDRALKTFIWWRKARGVWIVWRFIKKNLQLSNYDWFHCDQNVLRHVEVKGEGDGYVVRRFEPTNWTCFDLNETPREEVRKPTESQNCWSSLFTFLNPRTWSHPQCQVNWKMENESLKVRC